MVNDKGENRAGIYGAQGVASIVKTVTYSHTIVMIDYRKLSSRSAGEPAARLERQNRYVFIFGFSLKCYGFSLKSVQLGRNRKRKYFPVDRCTNLIPDCCARILDADSGETYISRTFHASKKA
jgi:hypothetical protein